MQVPGQVAAELEVVVLEDGWIASVPSEACSEPPSGLWAWFASPLPDWLPRRNIDTVGELLLLFTFAPLLAVGGSLVSEIAYDGRPPWWIFPTFVLPALTIFLGAKYLLASGPPTPSRWIFRVRSGVLQIDWEPVEVLVAGSGALLLSDGRELSLGHLSGPSRAWLSEILEPGRAVDLLWEGVSGS